MSGRWWWLHLWGHAFDICFRVGELIGRDVLVYLVELDQLNMIDFDLLGF